MVNNCANPQCGKPLHYLREGRIFVFEARNQSGEGDSAMRGHHLEHYWLCGACSLKFRVEQAPIGGIRLVPRYQVERQTVSEPAALAS
ncbi:MAG TPA: hypothetical protein VKX41_06980 [Alloacidobacterium sp.]|jgi:hypothetical protein|nr:hypothetical protein [Alloacidobacterium sp.]